LLSMTIVSYSQRLQIISESGYRIFLDNEFAGITSGEQDGLLLNNVAIGHHFITVKKGTEYKEIYEVDVKNGYNELAIKNITSSEITVSQEKQKVFPRKDGFYLAHLMTTYKNIQISKKGMNTYLIVDFSGDNKNTDELELEYAYAWLFEKESKNVNSIEDQYYGLFKGYKRGVMPKLIDRGYGARSTKMHVNDDSTFDEIHFFTQILFDEYYDALITRKNIQEHLIMDISGMGTIDYSNNIFTLKDPNFLSQRTSTVIKRPVASSNEPFGSDITFEFYPLPENRSIPLPGTSPKK
jgi:hypothetical protein